MRKESVCIKAVAFLFIVWTTLFCIRKFKKYTSIENNDAQYSNLVANEKSINIEQNKNTYPLTNVYSKPMTKLEIRENLGRSTWTLLHTLASVYPGIPSEEHKKDVLKFIYLLSKLYPCGDCAQHFQKLLSDHPPKIGNHDEFVEWLCKAHNVVNKRLGKEEFDCARVEERWECGCEMEQK